jgi:pimeloyl-ACP methyl ester carboxylesterase
MRQRTPDTLTKDILAKQRAYHFLGDDQIRALHDLFHSFRDSHDDMDLTLEELSRITTRTLLVHGDHDTYFPISIPLEIYRALPNACLWIVPSGGHIPIHEHGEAFARSVLEFFEGRWKF